jgi:hypothetical protein
MSTLYANIIAALVIIIIVILAIFDIGFVNGLHYNEDSCFVIIHVNSSHGTWVDNSHYIPERCRVNVYDDYQSPNMTKSVCIWGCSP